MAGCGGACWDVGRLFPPRHRDPVRGSRAGRRQRRRWSACVDIFSRSLSSRPLHHPPGVYSCFVLSVVPPPKTLPPQSIAPSLLRSAHRLSPFPTTTSQPLIPLSPTRPTTQPHAHSLTMRFLSRCSVIIALAVTLILYLGWVIPSTRQYTQWQKSWSGSVRRIVTFGDSWSDTGRYILNGPPPGYEPIRHPAGGPVWPEALCQEVCLHAPCASAVTDPRNRSFATR